MRASVSVSRLSGLRSKSAGLATSVLQSTKRSGLSLPLNKTEERQNRCAKGTSAGENPDNDESSHSEMGGFSPVTGESIACRSAGMPRNHFTGSAMVSLRLCVSAWVGGRVALR